VADALEIVTVVREEQAHSTVIGGDELRPPSVIPARHESNGRKERSFDARFGDIHVEFIRREVGVVAA
jgi:hypothetical protein